MVILIIGITIAILLELLLLSKKDKARTDIILAIWMFFIGLHLFLFYLQYTGLYRKYPLSSGFILPLPLVHGPFLYLYVSLLTNQSPGKKQYLAAHFLPPILMYLYLIHFFILPASEKIRVIESGGAEYRVFNTLNLIAIVLSGIIYVALSQIRLHRHRKNIREQFSTIEKINLDWLQYLVLGIGFIWAVVISTNFIPLEVFQSNKVGSDIFIFSAVVLFVCFIGFFGLKQTQVFAGRAIQVPAGQNDLRSADHDKQVFEKYAKSGLKDTDAEQLHKQLNEYMQREKPFLKSELSLSDLGESFGVHSNYLSQVINERENKNFYDYVNGYRIDEFKRLVTDPKKKNLTLLALAFECGFNSKSAFNSCFKKLTDQTPSEFVKLNK
jgi:AraC-like DNA-binding protein